MLLTFFHVLYFLICELSLFCRSVSASTHSSVNSPSVLIHCTQGSFIAITASLPTSLPVDETYTKCPENIVPCLCGYCGGAVDSVISVTAA